MLSLQKALEEGVVSKTTLLMKKHKFLGISEKNVLIILKIIKIEDQFNYNKALKLLELSKAELDEFLSTMLKTKLIKVKFKDDGKSVMNFDFSILWERLLSTLVEASQLKDDEHKYTWFLNRLNLFETPEIKKEVLNWIKKGNFNTMQTLVEKLSKIKIYNPDFETIKKLFSIIEKESTLDVKHLKELTKLNIFS